MVRSITLWPELNYSTWHDTATTLHLWTQIVGKIRLSLTPWINHSWQVALYVTSRGLGTSPIPVGTESFEIEFDFIAQRLRVRLSSGEERMLALAPQSVAEFYRQVMHLLNDLGIAVTINEVPNEIANPVPFSKDHRHCTYDADAVYAFWRVLVQSDRVFKYFRSGFLGKASPSHFFWGSFDLAVTRFSGRLAPPHPGGVPGLPDAVTREAYSHEVSSAGFWPGSDAFPRAAFYSYAYPQPKRFREYPVAPGAHYEEQLGEYVLPYDAVRTAGNPDAVLLDFLSSTYAAAAEAGDWDRARLECPYGAARRVRRIVAS